MQNYVKYKILIQLLACSLTKQTENQKLYEFSNFNYKGIFRSNSNTYFMNFDNESKNSLKIQFFQTNIHFELVYEDLVFQKKLDWSIDYLIQNDLRLEQSGNSTINILQFKNNEISENYSCPIVFTLQFNQTEILQNEESFEFDIFFESSQNCYTKMNFLNVKLEKSNKYQVVDSFTIILIYITLYALQFQSLFLFFKEIHQNKIWAFKKVLIYPYYFLIVFHTVFLLEIILQLGNINNKYEWYYIIPVSLTSFATFYLQLVVALKLTFKACEPFMQRLPICFYFSISILMSNYANIQDLLFYGSLFLIFVNLDISPNYLIIISTLFLPQIIYNFKFKIIELDGIYYLKLMAINIFQIVNIQNILKLYTRGCPEYYGNNLNKSEKIISCSISFILFCLQILIIHIQYQSGPRNLLPNYFKKKEISLLNKLTDDDLCPICLSEIKDQNIFNKKNELQILIKTQCGHVFHQGCLQVWYNIKKACPNCNAQIQLNTVEELDFV